MAHHERSGRPPHRVDALTSPPRSMPVCSHHRLEHDRSVALKMARRCRDAEGNRGFKHRLVADGIAHAALVYDGDRAAARAPYGAPEELPSIDHRKEYVATAGRQPDYPPASWSSTTFAVRAWRRSPYAEPSS